MAKTISGLEAYKRPEVIHLIKMYLADTKCMQVKALKARSQLSYIPQFIKKLVELDRQIKAAKKEGIDVENEILEQVLSHSRSAVLAYFLNEIHGLSLKVGMKEIDLIETELMPDPPSENDQNAMALYSGLKETMRRLNEEKDTEDVNEAMFAVIASAGSYFKYLQLETLSVILCVGAAHMRIRIQAALDGGSDGNAAEDALATAIAPLCGRGGPFSQTSVYRICQISRAIFAKFLNRPEPKLQASSELLQFFYDSVQSIPLIVEVYRSGKATEDLRSKIHQLPSFSPDRRDKKKAQKSENLTVQHFLKVKDDEDYMTRFSSASLDKQRVVVESGVASVGRLIELLKSAPRESKSSQIEQIKIQVDVYKSILHELEEREPE